VRNKANWARLRPAARRNGAKQTQFELGGRNRRDGTCETKPISARTAIGSRRQDRWSRGWAGCTNKANWPVRPKMGAGRRNRRLGPSRQTKPIPPRRREGQVQCGKGDMVNSTDDGHRQTKPIWPRDGSRREPAGPPRPPSGPFVPNKANWSMRPKMGAGGWNCRLEILRQTNPICRRRAGTTSRGSFQVQQSLLSSSGKDERRSR